MHILKVWRVKKKEGNLSPEYNAYERVCLIWGFTAQSTLLRSCWASQFTYSHCFWAGLDLISSEPLHVLSPYVHPPVIDRAGMGRAIVPRYPSHYYPLVPVTIVFWTWAQWENSIGVNTCLWLAFHWQLYLFWRFGHNRIRHPIHIEKQIKLLIFMTSDVSVCW